jgi:hypothetical protein
VIGHIERYEFCISKYELEKVIKEVMQEHPELKVPKGGKYPYADNDFSWKCYIKDSHGGELFSYKFSGDSIKWETQPYYSRIALIAIADYGNVLSFNRKLLPWEKWRMLNKFEKYFIDRVRLKVKCR